MSQGRLLQRHLVLRLIRQDPARASFDARFYEKSPLFWPIVPAAQTFADRTDWPDVVEYDRLFSRPAPVRFVAQPPTPRRGTPEVRWARDLYDARIARGEVPTRPRTWHDYVNALVWTTFPLAKAALHARQHSVIEAWLRDRGAVDTEGRFSKLPGERTREHDALALIDEGGIVVLQSDGHESAVLFGHALYEGLILGTRSMIARAIVVDVDAATLSAPALQVQAADQALAARLALPLSPEHLPRRPL